uniref:Uncharacterized protein n=1 Tax=Meloidogyne incognita TaxID=6306 RepID=A0A914KZM7_MELIC
MLKKILLLNIFLSFICYDLTNGKKVCRYVPRRTCNRADICCHKNCCDSSTQMCCSENGGYCCDKNLFCCGKGHCCKSCSFDGNGNPICGREGELKENNSELVKMLE